MKIERIAFETGAVADFFEEGLTALGALCARPWHDRLEVVAEGKAASLWDVQGQLQALDLNIVSADSSGDRDAAREIFPGCPLMFKLAEALTPSPPHLERVVLEPDVQTSRAPDPAVAEKLWRAQVPDTARWRIETPFIRAHHFSLAALVRCEVQAIDQHWSLHRVAMALPGGRVDDSLARELGFARVDPSPPAGLVWPVPDPRGWTPLLRRAIELETETELKGLRARQESHLSRELARVDGYFAAYSLELTERARRSKGSPLKIDERLAAAKSEHARHRADQVARHEISVVPHLDALLLVAEPAWRATLDIRGTHEGARRVSSIFVPRSRRWEYNSAEPQR